MINTFRNNAHLVGSTTRRLVCVCSLLFLISGCGKDDDDGEVRNTVALPTDIVLNLFCADIGIYTETCVLDDPDNPYAMANVNNDTKFDLANAAPSPKARFYLWATQLARSGGIDGEAQYYAARSLYQLYNLSDSDLIKDQAIRAYRSVLDNYFSDVTFFSTADFGVLPEVFYTVELRQLTALSMIDGIDPAWPASNLLFDNVDDVRNEFLARAKLIEWGYFYDEDSDQVFAN